MLEEGEERSENARALMVDTDSVDENTWQATEEDARVRVRNGAAFDETWIKRLVHSFLQ